MPLRRSLTFWLGLLGLVSIVITWVDSTRYRTNFAFQPAMGLHSHSSLHLGYSWGSSHVLTSYFERNALPPGGRLSFTRPHWERPAGRYIRVDIPYWIILLAYAEVWIVLLVWRRRRIRHAMPAIPLAG